MDSVFRNATNTASVPSYWLIDAMASYTVNSHLTLRMNGSTSPTSEYIDRVGGGHYIPGPGRQVHGDGDDQAIASMLIQIPDVLTAEQVAQRAACSTPRSGSMAASPPATNRRRPRTTCSSRKAIRRRASSAT